MRAVAAAIGALFGLAVLGLATKNWPGKRKSSRPSEPPDTAEEAEQLFAMCLQAHEPRWRVDSHPRTGDSTYLRNSMRRFTVEFPKDAPWVYIHTFDEDGHPSLSDATECIPKHDGRAMHKALFRRTGYRMASDE